VNSKKQNDIKIVNTNTFIFEDEQKKINKRIMGTALITGGKGYLIGLLKPELTKRFDKIIYIDSDIRDSKIVSMYRSFKNVDCIIHFASPSDKFDFQNEVKTSQTMIDGTINIVQLAKALKCKLIFASSMATFQEIPVKINNLGFSAPTVDIEEFNNYAVFKLAMERYIRSNIKEYLILNIPRVYDSTRNKGLIFQLKNGSFVGDKDQIVNFIINKENFIKQTCQVTKMFLNNLISKKSIYRYDNLQSYSIVELETMLALGWF
jgi:nucleoside-diphosphate-sugar epimerase